MDKRSALIATVSPVGKVPHGRKTYSPGTGAAGRAAGFGAMMLPPVLVVVLLICGIIPVSAQQSSDLFDPIYRDLEAWELSGLIDPLPLLRPYSPQLIEEALIRVLKRGNRGEALRAGMYLDRIRGAAEIHPRVEHTVRISGDVHHGEAAPGAVFSFRPMQTVGIDGSYSPHLIDDPSGAVLPHTVRPEEDYIPDWADFDLFDRNIKIRQELLSTTALGTGNLYFQAGLSRSSFGPFHRDGAVLSPYGRQAGRFSFTWNAERFSYELLLLELTASTDTGTGRYPGKRMVLHSFALRPAPWLMLNLYETVVWGGRVDLKYLIPVSVLYLVQGMGGYSDNSLIGVTAELKPLSGLSIPLTVYADDVHFNDVIRLDFDTKFKLSAQGGIRWNPPIGEIEKISLDYLAVMPYMYSHRDPEYDANFQNYTNFGTSLGPSLHPNSDRARFDIMIRPFSLPTLSSLTVDGFLSYSRHGNASAGITDGDGTIFDDGYDEDGRPTFQSETRFLTQDVLEHTFLAGIKASARLPVPRRSGSRGGRLELGYTFEHRRNLDLVADTQSQAHYLSISVSYEY